MTAFALIAALLVAAGLLWVLRPLLRRAVASPGVAREASNLAIIRDQSDELERDLATGVLLPDQYRESKADLERRALEEGCGTAAQLAVAPGSGRRTALVLAFAIPVAAGLLYAQLGNFDAFGPSKVATSEHSVTQDQVEQMVAGLAAKLEKQPDDPRGWSILARSYYVMQRFPDAAKAYARLAELVPNDAEVLADYADSLAMAQGRTLAGRPMELVQQALKIDPKHWKALAMAGTDAFDRKDYKGAVAYWERVRAVVPPDSDIAKSIDSSIAEARELGGVKGAPTLAAAKVAPATGGRVAGMVSLSAALAAKADPADTVFVFARAADGPKMPLAIVRKQVRDLPFAFALDDSQAMAPNMKLSSFPEVVIGARVSKSANAAPQPGDLQGLSRTVKVGASDVAVVIDQVLP